MTRELILENLKQTEEKISKLQKHKEKLFQDLNKFPNLTDKEKLFDIMNYGSEKSWVINFTEDGLIHEYLQNLEYRGTEVSVKEMVESILEDNICDNLEDTNEILNLFSFKILNEDEFEEVESKSYTEIRSKQDFLDMVEDIIEAKCSTFKFDW